MSDSYIDTFKEFYKEKHLSIENNTLLRLVIVLGTHCSLKCKNCNNLIPDFAKPFTLDPSVIISSMEQILKCVSSIERLELIGGEPFLESNLKKVLEYLLPRSEVKKIEITTNGTIVPSTDLISVLQHKKVFVEISDYGTLVEKSRVESFCRENSINYKILKIDSWTNSGDTSFRNRDTAQLLTQYKSCISSYFCKTLLGDKLFQCARSASLFELDICREPKMYLEINNKITSEDIFSYFFSDVNIACNYCDSGTELGDKIPVAEQE